MNHIVKMNVVTVVIRKTLADRLVDCVTIIVIRFCEHVVKTLLKTNGNVSKTFDRVLHISAY